MVFLHWIRAGVLTASVLLSGVVLGLSAALIYTRATDAAYLASDDDGWFPDADDFFSIRYGPMTRPDSDGDQHSFLLPAGHDVDTALTASISIITILTVPPLLIADMFKRKTWLSTVVVEASWLFVLWVLWLTCGAYTAWCNSTQLVNAIRCQISSIQCLEYKFVEVFSFVNWITLMLYSNTLFTRAVINHIRRHPIWLSPVKDAPQLPPLVFASYTPVDPSKNLSSSTGTFSIGHTTFPSNTLPHIRTYLHPRSDEPPSSQHSPLIPFMSEAGRPHSPENTSRATTEGTESTDGRSPPTYSEQVERTTPAS